MLISATRVSFVLVNTTPCMLCILPECTFAGFLAHHRRGKAQRPLGPQLAQEAPLPSAAALETWLRSGQQNPNWGIRICAESHKTLPAQKVTRVSKSFLISQANSNSSYHWLGVRSFDDDFLSASTVMDMKAGRRKWIQL